MDLKAINHKCSVFVAFMGYGRVVLKSVGTNGKFDIFSRLKAFMISVDQQMLTCLGLG